jgi:hypothetical protein
MLIFLLACGPSILLILAGRSAASRMAYLAAIPASQRFFIPHNLPKNIENRHLAFRNWRLIPEKHKCLKRDTD